jgi:hypothetical protein
LPRQGGISSPPNGGSSTFAPALKTNLLWLMHPDTHLRSASVGKARICTQLKSCTLTIFCLRDSFLAKVPGFYPDASSGNTSTTVWLLAKNTRWGVFLTLGPR